MAGLGFELRKVYNKGNFLAKQKAYGYAGIIYVGPMILGILLILAVVYLSVFGRFDNVERDHLLGLISYSILASLAITNIFSMVVTRYVSDMLYEEKFEKILPSYFSSGAMMLGIGLVSYGLFLFLSGIPLLEIFLNLLLFSELCLIWHAVNYLTAVKDYRSILKTFAAAILIMLGTGFVSIYLSIPYGLLLSTCIAYAYILVQMIRIMYRYFPKSYEANFEFLIWFDEYFNLFKVGIYLFIGLFAHIVINWFGPLSKGIGGLFRTAPVYDVSAMLAYLVTLVSTVSFVVSLEVVFYPKFRKYYQLYDGVGSVDRINQTEVDMLRTLRNELKYLSWKQLLATLLAMFVGIVLLAVLPLGFNSQMKGYFQTLCLGYGLYAVGNINLLLLLYFVDYEGAKNCSKWFAGISVIFSILTQFIDTSFIGYGFLLASLVLYFTTSARLAEYTKDLPYRVLGSQDIIVYEETGFFTRLYNTLEARRNDG
ncbi:exopolysaccharide Pel transporter PelG [Streptococcus sp. CCH8-C6]|uniref:exopolysaccharide Pel transporter PelG n=1 Tax=Streptococcus sp. CCH8-C6 TaxID=1768777 RepID=UPI00076AB242|nr:exopolysaccharide Pel transporter PelG [Streptococcus sp. CCH8-C6]